MYPTISLMKKRTSGYSGQLDIKTVMFGVVSTKSNLNVFNYCLIAAKMFIYVNKTKMREQILIFLDSSYLLN